MIRAWTAAALVLAACSGPAAAWNNAGHFTVAKLAWDRLSAKERVALVELLEHHPHWDRYFKAIPVPTGVSEAEFRFALASTWPDWLRNFAKAKDDEGKKLYRFHKSARHYINWPFVKPSDAELFQDKKPPIPDLKENVIVGIDTVRDELRATDKFSLKYRAVSLCWLLHLVGDIHQPLHNIGLISKYSPNGDMGGNMFYVKDQTEVVRLHGFWDDVLGREESYVAAYEKATANCAQLTRAEYERERFAKELERKTVEEWSKDAFALAVEHGYRNGTLRGWMIAFGKDTEKERAKAPDLPADYRPTALAVAQRQAALAGHRLETLLHEVAAHPKGNGPKDDDAEPGR